MYLFQTQIHLHTALSVFPLPVTLGQTIQNSKNDNICPLLSRLACEYICKYPQCGLYCKSTTTYQISYLRQDSYSWDNLFEMASVYMQTCHHHCGLHDSVQYIAHRFYAFLSDGTALSCHCWAHPFYTNRLINQSHGHPYPSSPAHDSLASGFC